MRKTIFHFCFIAGILCMQNAFSADSPQTPDRDNKPVMKSEAPAPPTDAVGMTKCYLEISKDPNYPGFPGGAAAFVKAVFNIQEKKN